MPLGIVSDEDFNNELADSKVEISGNEVSIGIPEIPSDGTPLVGEIIDIEVGRGKGNNNAPNSLRKIIGETGVLEGRREGIALAAEFGLSSEAADSYKHGATGKATYNKQDTEQKNHIEAIKKLATKRAGRKLLSALDKLTDDKLEEAPAGVIAGIAKSLSGVIKDLEPDVPVTSNGPGIQFVVFAPPIVQESKFPVLELKE